jgi:hypothetical protein
MITSLAFFAFFGVPVLVLLVALAGMALNARAIRKAAPHAARQTAEPDAGGAKALDALREIAGKLGPVTATAMLPDGRRALSGSPDGTLRLWDLESRYQLSQFAGATGPITTIEILPDGRRVLAGSSDGTLRLWDVETGAGRDVRKPGETADDIQALRKNLADYVAAVMQQTREQAPTDWTTLANALVLNRSLEVEIAKALVNKGVALNGLGRGGDAIEVFDDVLARFGKTTDPLLPGQAAKAQSLKEPL